jgi:predicted CXXCH cytochrome family protein
MSPSLLIGRKCPYCTHFRSLHDLMPFAGTEICQSCYRAHLAALEALSNSAPPKECSECHLTYQQLRDRAGLDDNQPATMDCHNENGVYRFLCRICSRKYVIARRELYGDTEFGHKLRLK